MYFVKMMLTGRFGYELPNAIIQSALGYQIRVPTISGADALISDGRPFSENGRRIKIDLNFGVAHR
jgi:hypothetical protein